MTERTVGTIQNNSSSDIEMNPYEYKTRLDSQSLFVDPKTQTARITKPKQKFDKTYEPVIVNYRSAQKHYETFRDQLSADKTHKTQKSRARTQIDEKNRLSTDRSEYDTRNLYETSKDYKKMFQTDDSPGPKTPNPVQNFQNKVNALDSQVQSVLSNLLDVKKDISQMSFEKFYSAGIKTEYVTTEEDRKALNKTGTGSRSRSRRDNSPEFSVTDKGTSRVNYQHEFFRDGKVRGGFSGDSDRMNNSESGGRNTDPNIEFKDTRDWGKGGVSGEVSAKGRVAERKHQDFKSFFKEKKENFKKQKLKKPPIYSAGVAKGGKSEDSKLQQRKNPVSKPEPNPNLKNMSAFG
jgi:hypothetical protein